MDSYGTLISFTNHHTFSERQLARLDLVLARIELNRLYLLVETTGSMNRDWLISLKCSAHDGQRIYAPVIKIEDALPHNKPGQVMLVSEPFEVPFGHEGELPDSVSVLLEAGRKDKIFQPGLRAVKP
jgi:hypothetical protein